MFLSGVQLRTRLDSRLKHAGMTDSDSPLLNAASCVELTAEIKIIYTGRATLPWVAEDKRNEQPSVELANRSVRAPDVDAADDHIAGIKRQGGAGRRCRRAGIAQHANFLVRADNLFRRRQLDPAVAAAGAHHRIRFRHVIKQRRIHAVFAAVFVGDEGRLDAALLASAQGEHEVDKSISRAEPGDQRGVGADLRRELGGIVRDDLLAVNRVVGNALENYARETQPARSLLAIQFQSEWMILPVPRRWVVTNPARCISRNRAVQQLVRMNKRRQRFTYRQAVITRSGMRLPAVGDAALDQDDARQAGLVFM